MNNHPDYCIGLDLGGTKLAAGLVRLPDGELLEKRLVPSRRSTGDLDLWSTVHAIVAELGEVTSTKYHAKLSAIGVGICELVLSDGSAGSFQTFDWEAAQVKRRLGEIAPTFIEADVRAAALAEATLGAGRGPSPFVYLSVGTGISCCLVIDGLPFHGHRGLTGTMASSRIHQIDGCNTDVEPAFVLEDFASGPALLKRYNQSASTQFTSTEQVLEAARQGNSCAESVVRSGANALGIAAGILVSTLDPAKLVVGGGLGLCREPYWTHFVASTRRSIWSELHRNLPIEPGATGVDAGVLGAALMAWNHARPAATQLM